MLPDPNNFQTIYIYFKKLYVDHIYVSASNQEDMKYFSITATPTTVLKKTFMLMRQFLYGQRSKVMRYFQLSGLI